MKKIITLSFILVSTLVFAQCPNGNLTLYNQSDIDSIAIKFPNCKQLNGNIYINDDSGVLSNLNGFENITSVLGDFTLGSLTASMDLTGLENLELIDGNLNFFGNSTLNLNGLNGLKTIKGDVNINNNKMLNFDGFNELTFIGGSAIFSNNLSEFINGFNKLLTITNGLSIRKNNQLVGLNGFANLETIGSNFLCDENLFLESIEGFDRLESIGGILSFFYNPNLNFISKFLKLSTIETDLIIRNNGLNSINGFNNLSSSLENVIIHGNSNLKLIDGLNALIKLNDDLKIYRNDSLVEVSGLTNLEYIKNDLSITDNERLVKITGLKSLDSIENNTWLTSNAIENFSGFENLKKIQGGLFLSENSGTNVFDGFNQLTKIGSLSIAATNFSEINGFNKLAKIDRGVGFQSNQFVRLAGFSSLNEVGGYISIDDNDLLEQIDGLENLKTVGWRLWIRENDMLTQINGFNNLKSIDTELKFERNGNLLDITGFQKLEFVGTNIFINSNIKLNDVSGFDSFKGFTNEPIPHVFNGLEFKGNAELERINGFVNLVNLKGYLNFSGNFKLSSINGLGKLESVTEFNITTTALTDFTDLNRLHTTNSIHMVKNASLLSLDGLETVTSSLTKLKIEFNPMLSNLNGLANVQSIDGQVLINFNDSLSVCNVNALCTRLADTSYPTYTTSVGRNNSGCESVEIVLGTCKSLSVDVDFLDLFLLYPNPVGDILNINNHYKGNYRLKLTDILGRIVFENELKDNLSINVSELEEGVYFLVIKDDLKKYSAKIIKK